MILFELVNVDVYYGLARAIKDFSIQVEDKSLVTIIGSNGAGKTTILRTISGLKNAESGKIYFRGESIENIPPEEIIRKGIAQVPQGRGIFPRLTILGNLQIGSYLLEKKKSLKLLDEIWGFFPILEERRNQLGGSLSGGEQQMLAIARALMASPKLLLMDEPSMGLAPIMLSRIGEIVENILKGDMTILLAEQNASFALKLAQKGYALQMGEVIFSGSSDELLNSDYVRKAYLGA